MRRSRWHDEHLGLPSELRDWRKSSRVVEWQIGHQCRVYHMAHTIEQQGMPIFRRTRHFGGTNGATCAAAIFHHNALPKLCHEMRK